MRSKLKKVGNSTAIFITREMKRYMGLEGEEVEIDYVAGSITIQRPVKRPEKNVKEADRNVNPRRFSSGRNTPNIDEDQLSRLKSRFPFLSLLDGVSEEVILEMEKDIRELRREGLPKRGQRTA